MSTTKLIEIFPNVVAAEKAYQYALDCGYHPKDITVIMSENYYDYNLTTKEDIIHGGATGATIGGIIGLIIAVGGNFIIPGIGIIIAGPLAGLVAGTLMGTLLSLGISESKAQDYAEAIESGKVILYVETMGDTDIEKKWAEIKNED